MSDILQSSVIFLTSSFCLLLGCGLLFASYCSVMEFFRYRKYYKTIMNHPEVFGETLDIPMETKKKIVESMDQQMEKLVKNVKPENQAIGLKIFQPEDEKLTG